MGLLNRPAMSTEPDQGTVKPQFNPDEMEKAVDKILPLSHVT